MNYKIIRKNELYHHGILGQKWGVRHGPPYPLDSSSGIKKSGGLKLDLQFFALKPQDCPTVHISPVKRYAAVMHAANEWIQLTNETEESFLLDVDGYTYTIDNTDRYNPRIIGEKRIPDSYTGLYERDDYN